MRRNIHPLLPPGQPGNSKRSSYRRISISLILFFISINCFSLSDTTFYNWLGVHCQRDHARYYKVIIKNTERYFFTNPFYYNKLWIRCKKKHAKYYRESSWSDSLETYIVKDHYMNGTLQMEAQYSSIPSNMRSGKCTFYNADGSKFSEGEYSDGNKRGVWTLWGNSGKDPVLKNYSEYTHDVTSRLPQNQSSLVIANINYRYKISKTALSSGRGLGVEIGYNFGYYLSQKFLFAVIGGVGFKDHLWNSTFSENYMTDFNSSLQLENMAGNDSIVVNSFSGLMNTGAKFHELESYAGLALRLPFRYAPVIKIYRGNLGSSYKTGYGSGLPLRPADNEQSDHLYYDILTKIKWGTEVLLWSAGTETMNYLSAFRNYKKEHCWLINKFALSVYYEELDTYNSEFEYQGGSYLIHVPFKEALDKNFLQKYSTEHRIGIRLSYGIY